MGRGQSAVSVYQPPGAPQSCPCLVVALPDAAEGLALAWAVMITSAENRAWPGDVAVADPRAAGLPVACVVRTAKIATIEAKDATRLGSLTAASRDAVRVHLETALAAARGKT